MTDTLTSSVNKYCRKNDIDTDTLTSGKTSDSEAHALSARIWAVLASDLQNPESKRYAESVLMRVLTSKGEAEAPTRPKPDTDAAHQTTRLGALQNDYTRS